MIEAMGVGILVVALGLAAGCGGGSGAAEGGGASGGGGESGSSGGEASYAGPIASTDVAHGQERFQAVCAPCHEDNAPRLPNLGWPAARVRRQIREGNDEMRPVRVARLSDADMESVLAYLQSVHAVTE